MSLESFAFGYDDVFRELAGDGHGDWAERLREGCEQALLEDCHGELSEWRIVVEQVIPSTEMNWSVRDGHVTASGKINADSLKRLRPWRKGPFELNGITIDTEWRSDWKWNRIADVVDWRDRRVLDVGCGNGYFGWRMLDAGARCVIGLDPFLLYVVQHAIVKRLAGPADNHVLPLSDSCLISRLNAFDIVLSMGVLYHRTSPVDHLQALRESLRPGGKLVLETLVVVDDEETVLVPQDRYAKMRNVWFIPSIDMLRLWLQRTGFRDIDVVDICRTTTDEQRRTDWMTFESLADFLDPDDEMQTIEGYPGPVRAIVTAGV